MTRREAWEQMKRQCNACVRHGAPHIHGGVGDDVGWDHETGSHSWVRCIADPDIVAVFMGDAPTLPPCYAIYKQREGWFFVWKNPDDRVNETWSGGPYAEKEEARRESWKDFDDRMMKGEIDEEGHKVQR